MSSPSPDEPSACAIRESTGAHAILGNLTGHVAVHGDWSVFTTFQPNTRGMNAGIACQTVTRQHGVRYSGSCPYIACTAAFFLDGFFICWRTLCRGCHATEHESESRAADGQRSEVALVSGYSWGGAFGGCAL
mmetsp:Transcript_46486/g.129131  ORF Transcript_46486/g.129131 Transcript_46486/m.129131 type:complete len:133 (+) Transcript_46486:93-491(+)